MQVFLRLIAIISFIVAIVWVIQVRAFVPEPILAFLGGLTSLALSFVNEKKESRETLDQRNRHLMLNHVENSWIEGFLENSLDDAVLLKLGSKEDPSAVKYPRIIKREPTNETVPAGKSMLEIFREIGSERSLLILGAPGSGKTTMLLVLTRQLIQLARQDETEPIPVVFNLASWKEKQTLSHWLVEELNSFYYVPRKTALGWINENRMLLLLDGLDEVKEDSRVKCVESINQFRTEHGLTSLVVCSRNEEYTTIDTKLSFEGAIALQPLTSRQISSYFGRFGKSLVSVKQILKKDKTLQELVETPLMLSIIAFAYKDMKVDELLALPNVQDRRKHILDTYVDRMFDHPTRSANIAFTKPQTLHYLSWLARTMIWHNNSTFQIEAMQPSLLEKQLQYPRYRLYIRLTLMLLGSLLVWLFVGWLAGRIGCVIGGIGVGLSFGLFGDATHKIVMIDKLKWSWKQAQVSLIKWLLVGLIGGPIVGAIAMIGLTQNELLSFFLLGIETQLIDALLGGLCGGLLFGLLFGLGIGLSSGLSSEQIAKTTSPGQRLRQTLFNALYSTFIGMLIGGLLIALIIGMIIALTGLQFDGLSPLTLSLVVGLNYGLFVGVISGFFNGYLSLIQHYTLRSILVKDSMLPRQLLAFLNDAVSLIFLRRVGGSYIFVHRFLMKHFAEMETDPDNVGPQGQKN